MAIPFNDHLQFKTYLSNPDWHKQERSFTTSTSNDSLMKRACTDLGNQIEQLLFIRDVQFIRDLARLVLKVPIRSLKTPIILKKNWKELERAKINGKLTFYSGVQFFSILAKIPMGVSALFASPIAPDRAKWLLDISDEWTAEIDGCASRLEALKEEGRKHAATQDDYNEYRTWLYSIDAKLCRKFC